MSTNAPLQQAIAQIERTLSRFPALHARRPALAFSGGKDSISLALAFREMGIPLTLRAVDMGYSDTWRGRIVDLADKLELDLDILEVSTLINRQDIAKAARDDLLARRTFLVNTIDAETDVTPCTNCYNCKIISLIHGPSKADILYFAHHGTDAMASFLKSAVMYYDRWTDGNVRFNKDNFRSLAQRAAHDLRESGSTFARVFLAYINEGVAQTSEPPIEYRTLHEQAYVIGRPMFEIPESLTAAVVTEAGLRAENSGCGHSISAMTRTPREIVHYEMIPVIEETETGRANLARLRSAMEDGLMFDGTAAMDVRGHRHHLLGERYKGSPDGLADRL